MALIKAVINRETGSCHIYQKNELIMKPYEIQEMTEHEYNELLKHQKKTEKKKEKKEKEENIIYTSLIIDFDKQFMAEEIYSEEKGTQFCVYDNGNITYENELNIQGFIHRPLYCQEVAKNAIHLPTGILEYGSDDALDNDLKSFIMEWLDIKEDFLQFAIWNIKRSWVYERFHTLNYLRALGDTGQGKSRFLDALGYLHYKPIATSGATTSAPVFRIIDKWKGTLIMDEADFQKSDEAQDIIKIINQGYEKGRHIMRCNKDNKNEVDFFDPFCPKILATRKTFEDKAVESRCITQVMTGTNRRDIKWNLTDKFWSDIEKLRNKLLLWRFNNYFKIKPDKEIKFDFGDIEPRVQQIVNSFISLFGHDETKLGFFKEFITNYQNNLIDERQNSWDGQIVGGIYELVKEGNLDISAQDIIDNAGLLGHNGKPLSPRSLSSSLKSLGFEKPIVRKVDGKAKRCLEFNEEILTNLFKRYGYSVTVVTIYTEQAKINNFCSYEVTVGYLDNEECENNNNGLKKKIGLSHNQCNDRNHVTEQVEEELIEDTEIIQLPCHICGQIPSNYYDDAAQGKPICESCRKNKENQEVN